MAGSLGHVQSRLPPLPSRDSRTSPMPLPASSISVYPAGSDWTSQVLASRSTSLAGGPGLEEIPRSWRLVNHLQRSCTIAPRHPRLHPTRFSCQASRYRAESRLATIDQQILTSSAFYLNVGRPLDPEPCAGRHVALWRQRPRARTVTSNPTGRSMSRQALVCELSAFLYSVSCTLCRCGCAEVHFAKSQQEWRLWASAFDGNRSRPGVTLFGAGHHGDS